MNDQFRVWVIRADYGASKNAFAENGYIGVGHGMDGVDLSRVTSPEEIRRLFVQEHPDERNEQSIGIRSSQVARFHLEIRSGDYVLTPELYMDWVRYGQFDSDNRYYANEDDGLPHRNRRSVNWSSERLRRDDLPDGLLQGGITLYEVADTSRKDGFLSLIKTLANPDVWIIRGGASGASVDYQLENGIAGVGFSLQKIDLSILRTSDDIRRAYTDLHPGASSRSVSHNVASVSNFILDIKINDYVLMPDGDRKRIHCGRVISDPYHVPNGPWKNRRNIEWLDRVATKSDLPSLPDRTRTVVKATDRLKVEVLEWMESSSKPKPGGEDGNEGARAYTIYDMLDDDNLFFEPDELRRIHSRFEDKKNLILQGPPGVGKTFVTRRLAYALMGEQADGRTRNVQFHQSYSYEEFVQGYRPTTNANDELKFELQGGTFFELCEEAWGNPNDRYVMVIDEINRGNLSRVFGELLSMIEKDKRGDGFTVRLAGGNEFWVPENVYILGTMNLADRSLAGMDYAMRRRFAFVTLEPQFGKDVFVRWLGNKGVPDTMIERINSRMSALNEVIASDSSLGRNFAVGHSYFCDIADGGESDWDRWYREIVKTEIQPLLEEYWFDNLGKADEEVEKLLDRVG